MCKNTKKLPSNHIHVLTFYYLCTNIYEMRLKLRYIWAFVVVFINPISAFADDDDNDSIPTVEKSQLQMPNAFSPNGDGINDIYKPKSGYQNITEFHAYIYNRWGEKLFEWTNPAEGWDGTYHGKPVKEGVYFVVVNAKGSDQQTYHIKRDVNLLRGYSETTSSY